MLDVTETLFEAYNSTFYAIGAVSALMLLQLVIADVLGITSKHTPGTSVPNDHSNILFRVSRTVANMNESIGIFLCAILFCVFTSASAQYTAYCAWGYFAFRIAYAICYYTNLQMLRSACFGLATLSLAALILVGFFT